MDIKDCIIYEKTIPDHPAVYDDFPENLLPELAEYLKSHGIGKLYCHQTEMFEKVNFREKCCYHNIDGERQDIKLFAPGFTGHFEKSADKGNFHLPDQGTCGRPVPCDRTVSGIFWREPYCGGRV